MNKRKVDSRAVTTAVAAVVACAIMGSAITKIMVKRIGHRPPAMESLKSNPASPKPSREARSLTA